MSLFKAKEWWTSGTVFPEEISNLFHNGSMRLSQLGVEGLGDYIVVGNPNGLLQIFRPYDSYQPTHVILESSMNDSIVQVESGKFVFGSEKEHIAVLYPKTLYVYSLVINEGQTEFGNQTILSEHYHHELSHPAVSMTVGSFGGIKDKDFICVQCINGYLTFFEQDVATFTCVLSELLLPGLIVYSQCTDSFIIYTTSWNIESYSYHNLSQLSEKHLKKSSGPSKKIIPDWNYNVGDTILSMQKVQTSSTSCSIVMNSDRSIYSLSDNGILKFMKRFDFDIVCSHSYLVGWFYDPNSRLMSMLVSETSTLLIYEHNNMTLLWSSQLTFTPIVINRGFFAYLPGTIVAVTESCEVKCLYLGTEPELFTAPPIYEGDVDYEKVQDELENIQNLINSQNDIGEIALMNKAAEREVLLFVSLSNNFETHEYEHKMLRKEGEQNDISAALQKCQIALKIQPMNKDDINVINVVFVVHTPFKCAPSDQTFHEISEEMVMETNVYVADSSPIYRNDILVMVTYINNMGNVRVLRKTLILPLSLFTQPVRPLKESKYKITLSMNKLQTDLLEVFKDFDSELFTFVGSSSNVVALESRNFSDDVVTIISAKSSQRYRIQSDNLSLINIILLEIIERHRRYLKKKSLSSTETVDGTSDISLHGGISSDIMQNFIQTIEKHWKLRQKLFEEEKLLETLSLQFILIQKRLMVKYREKPPTSCDSVHYLLLDTHQRIDRTSKALIELRENVLLCGQKLSGCINVICTLLKILDSSSGDYKLIRWALSPDILEHQQQSWEETAALNVISVLRERYSKSDKEKDKIIPFNDMGDIQQFDGQKFMKYVQMLLERALKNHSKSEESGISEDVTLRRNLSSESQLDVVEEERNASAAENVLEVPEGSLLGFHKKTVANFQIENEENDI